MEALEPRLTLSADLSWAFDIDVAQDAVWPSAAQGSPDDHALSIDIFGNSLSSEPFVAGPLAALPVAGESGDDAAWQYYDLAETFSLHSRPGADHVIYLDFNGHVTSGTSWNAAFTGGADIVTPAWSIDGDRFSLSDSEKALIQRVWARVAEDYAPLEIDVTTEEPTLDRLIKSGASDTQWGTRVVIGPNTWFDPAGGVAYMGSFNWDTDAPCFVFNTSENGITEATSHESGHTLGLVHDGNPSTDYYTGHGSGATSWGPIMGAPYSMNLTQWDSGEYYQANNAQDDLAIITAYNGFTYRPDDFGNTQADATALILAGQNEISAFYGVIETSSDYDMFSFQAGAGSATLAIDTLSIGANLDILAELYNATGSLIGVSNPIDALNASFSLSLPVAGNYFLRVSGTGRGDPLVDGYTDYGSLGNYRITGSVTAYLIGNAPPIASDDQAVAAVNTAVTIDVLANDTDDNGDPLAVTSVTQGSHGTVAITTDGTLIYTPDQTFIGVDTFGYTISDEMGGFDTAQVTVTVAAPAPLVNGGFEQDLLGWEATGAVTAPTSALGETPVEGQKQGVLTTANASGGDVLVSNLEAFLGLGDGMLDALAPGSATAGSAIRQEVTAIAGQSLVVQYNFATNESTPDNTYNDFSFFAVSGSGLQEALLLADTSASGFQASSSSYKQSTGYRQFSYTFADTGVYTIGLGVSESKDTAYDTALLIDAVTMGDAVNAPPTAVNDNGTVNEDQAVTIDVLDNDFDADGDALSISAITQGAAGSVAMAGNGHITYTPQADFHGVDSFTYTIVDGNGGQATGLAVVTVTPENDAPIAVADNASTVANIPVVIDVLFNDVDTDDDVLTVVAVTPPLSGTVAINPNSSITYTPDNRFSGQDSFTYTIDDNAGGQATATVTISVSGATGVTISDFENGLTGWETTGRVTTRDGSFGEAPAAGQYQAVVTTTNAYGGNIPVSDLETFLGLSLDKLDAITVGTATAGSALRRTLDVTAGQTLSLAFSFLTDEATPDANYNDFAFFTLTGSNTEIALLLADTQATGFATSPTAFAQSTGYGVYDYTFPSDGQYVIGFGVSDSRDTSYDTALLLDNITLTGESASTNTPPLTADDATTTTEDQTVTLAVLSNDSDPDDDALNVVSVTQAAHGSVAINGDNRVTYTPQLNYHGNDTFTYTVADGNNGVDTATVAITVTPLNDLPVAQADSATISQGEIATISVLVNDSDVDGDALTLHSVTQAANGNVAIGVGNLVIYTPAADFHGVDSFGYTADDGLGGQATATVTITVASLSSGLLNGGFEDALNGWDMLGDASVQTSDFGESPAEGQLQGVLTTKNTSGGNAAVADLEAFLGLASETLDDLAVGIATAGSAVRESVNVAAGQELAFYYNFATNESTPDVTYNDFSFVSIVGPGVQVALLLADTHVAGFDLSASTFQHSTGYQAFHYAFPQVGQYTIGFGVLDSKDTGYDSAVMLDAVRLQASTAAAAVAAAPSPPLAEPGSSFADSEAFGTASPPAAFVSAVGGVFAAIDDPNSDSPPASDQPLDDADPLDLMSQDWEQAVDLLLSEI